MRRQFLFRVGFLQGICALLFTTLPMPGESAADARARFQTEDAKLNDRWSELKATLDEWTFGPLQEEQRNWLEYRDAAAREEAVLQGGAAEGEEASTAEFWQTRALITSARIRMLEGFLKPGDEDDWSGEWIDGYGGVMRVVQDGKRCFFTIEVVRGPTYHQGFIAGVANINQAHARFTDANDPERASLDGEETWLDFRFSNPRIEVSGVNTGYYHGVRAYFDGTYVRVGALSPEDAATVRAGKLEE